MWDVEASLLKGPQDTEEMLIGQISFLEDSLM